MFNVVPMSVKVKAAFRAIGLGSTHIKAVNSLISRVKSTDLGDLAIPDGVNDVVSLAKVVTEKQGDFDGMIPSQALTLVNTALQSPKARSVVAKTLWSSTKFLTTDEKSALQEALTALADSQFFSDRTDYDTEEEYISDAILPALSSWMTSKTDQSQHQHGHGITDSHADLLIRCPYCYEIFVPAK